MRIGVNSRIYQGKNSGIPYYLECLYSTLQRIDSVNDYIFFQTESRKKLGNTLTKQLLSGYLGALQFDLFGVNEMAKSEKVSILHGPSHTLPLFKNPSIKYVLTVHDLFLLKFPQMSPTYYRFMFQKILERSLHIADVVIADSHNTKQDILNFFDIDENKIEVIHLGIHQRFIDNKPQKRIIGSPYFFSITTHPERKNITSVLKIISRTPDLRNYIYVIAGLMSEDTTKRLHVTINELGIADSVQVLGYVSEDDLLSLYQHASFFVFPSFYEGFGFPVAEAMATGCPVITSNTSSLIEILPQDEWRFDPYSLDSISDTMSRMISLTDIERKKTINANLEFSRRFSWEKSAIRHLEVFTKLVGDN